MEDSKRKKNKKIIKEDKPSIFIYNSNLSEEANIEIERLYKEIEDNKKKINDLETKKYIEMYKL